MKRVVVTGMGCICAAGNSVDSAWARVSSGDSAVDKISAFDASELKVQIAAEIKDFDPSKFLSFKQSKNYARFVQLAIAASKEAIEDAGLKISQSEERYGCAIGVGLGDLAYIDETSCSLHSRGAKAVSPFFVPRVIANMAAGNTAMHFGFKGPNICPTTACTSGTHAIGEAWLYIRSGYADAMLCGGSESVITPLTIAGFSNMKALSRNNSNPALASRPFDKSRDGFVVGEGAGMLMLESLEHAEARGAKIYAELVGYGLSADAYHLTAPPPRGEGAKRCMESALSSAGIEREKVGYINAHGTGTYYNDIHESEAISDVFSDSLAGLHVSSTKGVTGHCLGAAGGIEGVFIAKSIYHQELPPTANLDEVDPRCLLSYAPKKAVKKPIICAMSNSFGFGGTNASIIMQKF